MAKSIPIGITKIKVSEKSLFTPTKAEVEKTKYLFTIESKNEYWEQSFVCERDELLKFKTRIEELLNETNTAELLNVSAENAKIIDFHYQTDSLCRSCSSKFSNRCNTCLFILESPLERKLFLELHKASITFTPQQSINLKGELIFNIDTKTPSEKRFANILTIPDFYIDKGQKRVCIYTDGHTYHERTEDQAMRDRNIDRKLQNLNFTVLRYTGKEINDNIEVVIKEIKAIFEN